MTQQPKEKSGVSVESMAPDYPDFYRVDGIVEHCLVYLSETAVRDLYAKLGEVLGEPKSISREAVHRLRNKRIQKERRDGVCSHGTRVTMGCAACNEMDKALFDRSKP